MSFLYFAYGSNMWTKQMVGRCPSAQAIERASIHGWALRYDKPGVDGSAKLNLVPEAGSEVHGVVYEIADDDRSALDAAEPGYDPIEVEVVTATGSRRTALSYRWTGERSGALPYRWYVEMAQRGARQHGIPSSYWANHLNSDVTEEPLVEGLRPAGPEDLSTMQSILSDAIHHPTRYSIHPGELVWWIHHADPRRGDQFSYWIQEDRAMLEIDSGESGEISVFARPGVSPIPLIEWGQRRLHGSGEIGWVCDEDTELIDYLSEAGYQITWTERRYIWDLDQKPVPRPELPEGWVLRHVEGEHEADNRRTASHRAFKSTMDEQVHLERYLRFMRSAGYVPEHDLVAVAPGGVIASFIVWWADPSGVAQIEPFGTHPEFQRQGVGRALMYYALGRMEDAGMRVARVGTDEPREDATGFYEGIGFDVLGKLHWWGREPRS